MAKKSISISNVEETDFEKFKEIGINKGISLSNLFSQALQNLQEENNDVNKGLQEENTSLQNKIKELETNIKSLQDANNDVNISLQKENTSLQSKIKELETNIESLQDANNNVNNDYLLDFTGFDKYILELICKKESDKTGNKITPAKLLKAMFLSYVLEEKTYYFDIPGYFKLMRLKREYEQSKISIDNSII